MNTKHKKNGWPKTLAGFHKYTNELLTNSNILPQGASNESALIHFAKLAFNATENILLDSYRFDKNYGLCLFVKEVFCLGKFCELLYPLFSGSNISGMWPKKSIRLIDFTYSSTLEAAIKFSNFTLDSISSYSHGLISSTKSKAIRCKRGIKTYPIPDSSVLKWYELSMNCLNRRLTHKDISRGGLIELFRYILNDISYEYYRIMWRLVQAKHKEVGSGDKQEGQALPPCYKKAYLSYQYAMEKSGLKTDSELYNWLKEYGFEEYELPAKETWTRYVKEGRRVNETNKNTPRAKRTHGNSIVTPDQI